MTNAHASELARALREAHATEARQWAAQWLGQSGQELDGRPIRLLTLRDWVELQASGNAYTGARTDPQIGDLLALLFVLTRRDDELTANKQWLAWAAGLPLGKVENVILQALQTAWGMFPDNTGDTQKQRLGSPPYCAEASSIVALFAGEFGWTPEEIFSQPLCVLGQLARCIARKHSPHTTFHNPTSDAVKTEWLKKVASQN